MGYIAVAQAMHTLLETEFGGPGSLQSIDQRFKELDQVCVKK
jgi:hypothetical protein